MAPPFFRRQRFTRTTLTLGAIAVVVLVAAVWFGVPGVRPSRADLIAARASVVDSEELFGPVCKPDSDATVEVDWVRGTIRIADLEALWGKAEARLLEELEERGLGEVRIDFADPDLQLMSCTVLYADPGPAE